MKPYYPFLGYYNKPKEIKTLYREDDFIRFGDLGRFDEEEIIPTEVENIIFTLKDVENVCVVGVPDLECGELAVALVVKPKNSDIIRYPQ